MRLRALLLDNTHAGLAPRAETLMYAADRAEHVAAVIRPALDRGAVVVTDRYIDSSLAYQGAGRELPIAEVAQLNEWATGGLTPDLTILLDLSPAEGLGRRASSLDRLEAEPTVFHQRVRAGFLARAAADPPPLPGPGRVPRPRRDQPRDPGPRPRPAARPGARDGRGDHRQLPGGARVTAGGAFRPARRPGGRRRAA